MPSTTPPDTAARHPRTARPAVLIAVAPSDTLEALLASMPARDADAGILEELSLDGVERFIIRNMMARCDGNVSHAARALGLSRSALYRRLQRYGL